MSGVSPCVADLAGNEYDLSGLSKVRKPWVAVDTSGDGKKRTFYLSVCTPLPYILGCHGEFGAVDSRSVAVPPPTPPHPTLNESPRWPFQAMPWGPAW